MFQAETHKHTSEENKYQVHANTGSQCEVYDKAFCDADALASQKKSTHMVIIDYVSNKFPKASVVYNNIAGQC